MSFQPSTLIFLDQLGLGLRPEAVVQLVQTRISQRKLESGTQPEDIHPSSAQISILEVPTAQISRSSRVGPIPGIEP